MKEKKEEGFKRLNSPVAKTEFEIVTSYRDKYKDYIDANIMPSEIEKEVNDKANTVFYLSSDVDARIKFYTEMDKKQADDIPNELYKILPPFKRSFNDALFVFCFGDMTEDFNLKISKLGEMKI